MTTWEAEPGDGLYAAGYRDGYRSAWRHCVTMATLFAIATLITCACLTISS